MGSKFPQIARKGYGRTGLVDWTLVFAATSPTSRFVGVLENEINLSCFKACQLDLEIQAHQRLQLDRQDLPVSTRLLGQPVVGKDVGSPLNGVEVCKLHGWHFFDPQQLCGRHPTVAGEDLRLIVDEDGIAKAKSLDALGDLADLLVGVRARVTRIGSERFDREDLDLHISSYPLRVVLDAWCEFERRGPAPEAHGSAFAQSEDCASCLV
jgi:hypothetical protein